MKQAVQRAIPYMYRLRDIRFAGQILFVVVVLLVSWSGVKAIDSNYILQRQIVELQQQNDLQQLENNNLNLQNQYYNSNQYLELSARQNFGLAAPGEKEVVVPKDIALSYVVPEPKTTAPKVNTNTSGYQSNVEAWLNFFLHRQNN